MGRNAAYPDPNRIAHGGKTLYGARVGILMLETRFPRIPGDMGNGTTWPFPVLYKVVPGATPDRVVRHKSAGLTNAFLDAAAELVQLGADGITTTCGFLSLYQRQIAQHVGVPVATSSLMQIPFIERILPPGRRVARSIRPAPSCHTARPSPARMHSTAASISTAIAYDSATSSPAPNSPGLGASGPPSPASEVRWSRCAPSWIPRQICCSNGVAVDGTSAIAVPGPGTPGRHIQVRRASRRVTGRRSVTCSLLGDGR